MTEQEIQRTVEVLQRLALRPIVSLEDRAVLLGLIAWLQGED